MWKPTVSKVLIYDMLTYNYNKSNINPRDVEAGEIEMRREINNTL